jgi:hypothetical protein
MSNKESADSNKTFYDKLDDLCDFVEEHVLKVKKEAPLTSCEQRRKLEDILELNRIEKDFDFFC